MELLGTSSGIANAKLDPPVHAARTLGWCPTVTSTSWPRPLHTAFRLRSGRSAELARLHRLAAGEPGGDVENVLLRRAKRVRIALHSITRCLADK